MSLQDDPGVAFTETIVQADHRDRDWFYAPRYQVLGPGSFVPAYWGTPGGPHGVQRSGKRNSLMEMALSVVIKNLDTTTEETLAGLPMPYLCRIYNESVATGMLSFHAWKILSKLFVADPGHQNYIPDDDFYCYCILIRSPSYELSYYTGPVSCPDSFDFLTCIIIDNIDSFRTDEFLSLARLKNLLTLKIVDQAVRVTDRLVKGWSETEGGFPVLQQLTLTSRAISLSSFQYISTSISSLALYKMHNSTREPFSDKDWRDCRDIAQKTGWDIIDFSDEETVTECIDLKPSVPPSTLTAYLHLIRPGNTYPFWEPSTAWFYRSTPPNRPPASSSSNSAPSPTEPPPRGRGLLDNRMNLQPRKRRRLQEVMSAFRSPA